MSYLFPYGVILVACLVPVIVRWFERRIVARLQARAHFALLTPEMRADIRSILKTAGHDGRGRMSPRNTESLSAVFWLELYGLAKSENREWLTSGSFLTRRGRVFAKDVARLEEL